MPRYLASSQVPGDCLGQLNVLASLVLTGGEVVVVAHFALLHQLSDRSCTIWWRGELLLVESTVWWNHLVETRATNGRNPASELAPTADTWDLRTDGQRNAGAGRIRCAPALCPALVVCVSVCLCVCV